MAQAQLAIVKRFPGVPAPIPYAEQLADHDAILAGYFDTQLTRGFSDSTMRQTRQILTGWFAGFPVEDTQHPEGERQLLIWEAMEPASGRQRIKGFAKGLVDAQLTRSTVRGTLGQLRRLCDYVLQDSYIPGDPPESIMVKYGTIAQPVLEYDYPAHQLDNEREGFALVGDKLDDFYDFVRENYIDGNQKKLTAARDYAMIVLAGESGLRAEELAHLDAGGPHRDLFYAEGRLQTRFGKGTRGSGPRNRKTIFNAVAQETLRVYEGAIRPQFPGADTDPALFLAEGGGRMTYKAMWRQLKRIEAAARKADIELPPRFCWHDLRRSFATNFIESHPDKLWVLMHMMGHLTPTTIHRYIKHSPNFFERAMNGLVEELLPGASR